MGVSISRVFATLLATAALPAVASAAQVVASGTAGTTGATALYMTLPSELTTSDATATAAELATFLGKPDGDYTGISGAYIQYDLGNYRMVDGAGQDFNVYEVDFGAVEFNSADIFVSANGIDFFNVESTFAAAIDLAGDEAHGNASFRRSYDLAGAVAALGATQFRYLRLDGTLGGPISGSNGFDPDSVGYINYVDLTPPPTGAIPEPATWAMMIGGFGLVGGAMRRRSRQGLAVTA